MEGRESAIESVSYHIRDATKEDVAAIKALIRSASIHSTGTSKGKRAGRVKGRLVRGVLSKLFSPIYSSGKDWRNFVVAISDEGALIGCGQVKPRQGGIWEVASIAVDKTWRGKGVPIDGSKFVFAHFPRPLWGTCPSTHIPFYKRLGAVEVVDPKKMPPFLRRRQRLFNALLRLARKKGYLAVMVVDT